MKNKNNITEIVFILDRSGSMGGLESDTIGGFNSMLRDQKKKEGKAFVSTVLFDHESIVLHDRIPVENVPEMTDSDYTVRGCTALLDAIGDAVKHIGNIHKYARPEDVPEHTMFIITTDGLENASRRYNSKEIKALIEKKKKLGWEFLFIGANIDAIETANYHADSQGTAAVFRAVNKAVGAMRACAPLSAAWSEEINEDYQSRK